jgi:hypothetical protein
MSVTLIDGVKTVAFNNGILRIDCIEAGPNGEERPSGTLLIPGNQAGQVLQALVKATQELDKRLREQQAAAKPQATAGNA